MKKLIRLLSLLLAVLHGGFSLEARRGRATKPDIITPTVDPSIAQLADQYRDIDMVVEKAKRDAAEVQRQAELSVKEANSRAERRQSRFSRRKEDMLRRERERKAVAERKAREREEKIRKDAEAESLRIIQEAEKRALDLRNKLEAQEQYDRANSKPEITAEWQREVRREFANDSLFMKDIIVAGETSRLEKQDFIALFDEQEKWFNEQVDETTHFFDESYKTVMRKKNALSVLVDAQRQADALLAELVHQHHLSEEAHKQLRVAALYEINDYLQRENKREVFIAGDVIRGLVNTVAEEAVPGVQTVKITTEKEKIEKLSQRVAELESGEGVSLSSDASFAPVNDSETAKEAADWSAEVDGDAEGLSSSPDEDDDDDWAEESIKQLNQAGDAAISQVNAEAAVKIDASLSAAERAQLEKERDEMVARITADKESAIAALKQEMEAQREAAAQEQERAHAELTSKLKSNNSELYKLQDEVARLQHESKQLKQQHERERSSLEKMVGTKQEEKVALEASLAKLSEQLRLLTTTSEDRLLKLASQMSQEKVQQEHLQRVLARKTREKVELERTLGTVQGQLQRLHITTDKLIKQTADRFEKSQQRFEEMQSQLSAKQSHTTELELALKALQNRLDDAAGVLQGASSEFTVMEKRNSDLSGRLASMQDELQLLRSRLLEVGQNEAGPLQERLQGLAAQTNQGMQELRNKVLSQRDVLTHRQRGYDQMHQLEKQMTHARRFRGADAERDKIQADLLDQLTAYGENLAAQHQQVGSAADRLAGSHGELEHIIEMLMPENADEQQAPSVTRLEEGAAWLSELLGDMGGIDAGLPLARHSGEGRDPGSTSSSAPLSLRDALMQADHDDDYDDEEDDDDDEEEIHDPADEPEAPEVYHPDEDEDADEAGDDLTGGDDSDDADTDDFDDLDDLEGEEEEEMLEEDAVAILDDEGEEEDDEDEEEEDEEAGVDVQL